MEGVRLNKYISDSGFCSRRVADELIAQGRVTINGRDIMEACLVVPGDRVAVDGEQLRTKKRAVYIALNKPVGITCTVDPEDKTNIADFVGYKERIYPIGRLDKPSQGLIFLTNDGDIVNKILRAGNAHQKEYVVNVHKPLTEAFLTKMAAGVRLDKDTRTLPCKVSRMGESQFRITLTQGLNRQIRRMCEAMGYNVTKLNRTRIMNITIKGLDTGQWRFLTTEEVEQIMAMTENSAKTHFIEEKEKPVRTIKSAAKSSTKPQAKSQDRAGGRTSARPTGKSGVRDSGKSVTKSTGKSTTTDGKGTKSSVASRPATKSTARSTTKSAAPKTADLASARPARKAAPGRKPKTAYDNYRAKGRNR